MDFSGALIALKAGFRIARPSWKEDDINYSWLETCNDSIIWLTYKGGIIKAPIDYLDILAEDWYIVPHHPI